MGRFLTLMLASLLACFLVSQAEARTAYERDANTEHQIFEMLGEVDRLMQANEYMRAKELLQKCSVYDPSANSGIIHERLSLVYKHFGNLNQACVEGLIAYRFDPSLKNLPLDLAMSYKEMGQPDLAIQWAQTFLQNSRPDRIWRQKAEDLIADIQKQKEYESQFDPNAYDYIDQFSRENELHPWPADKMPIKVYVGNGQRVPGYQPIFRQRVFEALTAWMNASNGKVAFRVVEDQSQADLKIDFSSAALKPGEKIKFMETAGLTNFPETTAEENWHILKSTISLKTINDQSKQPVDDDTLKAVALHEIGHALGLTGHSTNINDIMYYSDTSRRLSSLTKRDKATIARLYSTYPLAGSGGNAGQAFSNAVQGIGQVWGQITGQMQPNQMMMNNSQMQYMQPNQMMNNAQMQYMQLPNSQMQYQPRQ